MENGEAKKRLKKAYEELVFAYSLLVEESQYLYPDVVRQITNKLDYSLTVFSHDLKMLGVEVDVEENNE